MTDAAQFSVRLPENRLMEAHRIAFDDSQTEAARIAALKELLAFSDEACDLPLISA